MYSIIYFSSKQERQVAGSGDANFSGEDICAGSLKLTTHCPFQRAHEEIPILINDTHTDKSNHRRRSKETAAEDEALEKPLLTIVIAKESQEVRRVFDHALAKKNPHPR